LRVVRGTKRPAPAATTSIRKKPRPVLSTGSERRKARGPGPKAVREEFLRLGGPRGTKFYEQLVRAAEALASDREKDALRLLRPLRAAMPQSATVHEQMGIALYRSGRYDQAAEELEAYVAMCGAVDQHPALMDCYRALKQWKRVETLWDEIGKSAASPKDAWCSRAAWPTEVASRRR
jgi:thioredoxin-like negative regulator of GroEL